MNKNIEEAKEFLGLESDASESDTKEAYRNLVKKWHPDINKTDESEMMIRKINAAYATIMKDEFGVIDIEMDYYKWWLSRFGKDPIWGE